MVEFALYVAKLSPKTNLHAPQILFDEFQRRFGLVAVPRRLFGDPFLSEDFPLFWIGENLVDGDKVDFALESQPRRTLEEFRGEMGVVHHEMPQLGAGDHL